VQSHVSQRVWDCAEAMRPCETLKSTGMESLAGSALVLYARLGGQGTASCDCNEIWMGASCWCLVSASVYPCRECVPCSDFSYKVFFLLLCCCHCWGQMSEPPLLSMGGIGHHPGVLLDETTPFCRNQLQAAQTACQILTLAKVLLFCQGMGGKTWKESITAEYNFSNSGNQSAFGVQGSKKRIYRRSLPTMKTSRQGS